MAALKALRYPKPNFSANGKAKLRRGSRPTLRRPSFPQGRLETEFAPSPSPHQVNHALQVEGLGKQIHQVHLFQTIAGCK